MARAPTEIERGADVGQGNEPRKDLLHTGPDMVYLEDTVSEVGQGRIPDHAHEELGATDKSVILQRSIWEREMRALCEGRPLKQWVPEDWWATPEGTNPFINRFE